jgi:hypothetical protein
MLFAFFSSHLLAIMPVALPKAILLGNFPQSSLSYSPCDYCNYCNYCHYGGTNH